MSVLTALMMCAAVGTCLAIDGDADGMSDVWQAKHSIASADASLDTDNDGYTQLEESVLRSDPADPNSPGRLVGVSVTGGALIMSVRTTDHVRYRPQRSEDGNTWFDCPATLNGDGALLHYDASQFGPEAGAKIVVRVRVLSPLDRDGDGLDAWEEAELGLSDSQWDSDGDGLGDGVEFGEGFDPDSAVDTDGDSLPDDWELFYHGDIVGNGASDGDSDGVTDLDELRWRLNPTSGDSDADGFGDKFSHGLVARWRFDDLWFGAGGVQFTSDSSGRGAHAEVHGSIIDPTGGRHGGVAAFGEAGSHILCPPALLDGEGDVTVALWVKLPAAAETSHRAILGAGDSANINEFLLRYDTGVAPDFDSNQLQLFTGETPSSAEATDGAALFDETWHSIVCVRSDITDSLTLYIDGVRRWTKPTVVSPLSLGPDAWFVIGGHRSAADGAIEEGLGGAIDDVWLWSRALSESEVGDLLTLNSDGDGDGLPDHVELANGTNATLEDTDGDGLSDAYELATGSDPLTAAPPSLPTNLEVFTPPTSGAR